MAIQDAMGWLDYHLHEFRLLDADEKRIVSIGIPTDDDPDDRETRNSSTPGPPSNRENFDWSQSEAHRSTCWCNSEGTAAVVIDPGPG